VIFADNKIARSISTVFDATSMHERPQMAAETQLVDDGTGNVDIWRVRKFGLQEVEDKFEGIFFSGDCYLLKYTYIVGSKENYILYYWLVSKQVISLLKKVIFSLYFHNLYLQTLIIVSNN